MKRNKVVVMLGLFCFLSAFYNKETMVEADNTSNVELHIGVKVASSLLKDESDSLSVSRRVENEVSSSAEEYVKGYVTASKLNVRSISSIEGVILNQLSYGSEIEYVQVNDNWCKIELDNSYGYVHMDYVSNNKPEYSNGSTENARVISIPSHKDFKSYMSYRAIKSCSQKVLQDFAYTGTYGIRMVNGRYCVAVGTACNASVGDYGELILENGARIPIIVSDFKSTLHTQADNLITASNGCCSEFIVDTEVLDRNAKRDGTISSCCESWKSPVVKIIIYNKNFFS